MVPGDDPVVQAQHGVGEGEVVVAVAREPLEDGAVVVGQISGDPSLEGGQAGFRSPPDWGQEVPRAPEGAPVSGALLPDDRNRCGGQKRMPAEAFGVAGTIEQQQVRLTEEVLRGVSR